jgi:hypothetical protein
MYKNEVIWVFGFDAIGKKTLMLQTAMHKDARLRRAIGYERETIFIPLVPGKRERRQKIQNLFSLYDATDITKELCNVVYLIHGQWADFDSDGRHLSYFHDIYPELFDKCLFLTTDPKTRVKRMQMRGMESTNGDNPEIYNEQMSKYFKQIITLNI